MTDVKDPAIPAVTEIMKGSGLEDLGMAGGEFLREALTNCSDPLLAIEEFQSENGILLPSLKPALPFLDLHGMRRLDFHTSVVEELREKLVQKISNLANSADEDRFKKLEALLQKCYPAIKVKTLRPVVMCILKHLPEIKEDYLVQIAANRQYYEEAATEVKRQIWQDNQSLFGDEVSPLFSQYIKEKEETLLGHENSTSVFYMPSPRMRRQGEVVQKLVHMIGRSLQLYDMVLQFLRTLFLQTRNTHYCTLRAELLMALHDLEIQEICSVDPSHKFTWCVDACVRERFVDTKRARELQGFLHSIKQSQEQLLGDLAMILCDPFTLHTISLSTVKALQHCINFELLPRDNHDLILLVRLMALGFAAWDMIDSQVFKEPKLGPEIFSKFLPYVVNMLVDDQLRSLNARLSDAPPVQVAAPPDLFLTVLKLTNVGSMIVMYYTLQVTRQKDKPAVMSILPALTHCESDRAFDETFLHTLISYLITMSEDFSQEDFCIATFDEFLIPGIKVKSNIVRHILRLLWYIYARLPPARLKSLMAVVASNCENCEAAHTVYKMLEERIAAHQPSPSEPEPLEAPLIPAPAQ
ncbi:negative elongation factor B [Octopus vulgaris]|uniref:Negative elongation factor B n=2 Tax=Octopus TaxID=6643 RepID=A0AA36AJY9_OCTVU|nr:negative elongation factor B [Octopus sinensis]CAI9716771.1 negative elongation factor B [Octopus vulgaris]